MEQVENLPEYMYFSGMPLNSTIESMGALAREYVKPNEIPDSRISAPLTKRLTTSEGVVMLRPRERFYLFREDVHDGIPKRFELNSETAKGDRDRKHLHIDTAATTIVGGSNAYVEVSMTNCEFLTEILQRRVSQGKLNVFDTLDKMVTSAEKLGGYTVKTHMVPFQQIVDVTDYDAPADFQYEIAECLAEALIKDIDAKGYRGLLGRVHVEYQPAGVVLNPNGSEMPFELEPIDLEKMRDYDFISIFVLVSFAMVGKTEDLRSLQTPEEE